MAEKTWPVTSVEELVAEVARLGAENGQLRADIRETAQDGQRMRHELQERMDREYVLVVNALAAERARVQAVRDLCDRFRKRARGYISVSNVRAAIGDEDDRG